MLFWLYKNFNAFGYLSMSLIRLSTLSTSASVRAPTSTHFGKRFRMCWIRFRVASFVLLLLMHSWKWHFVHFMFFGKTHKDITNDERWHTANNHMSIECEESMWTTTCWLSQVDFSGKRARISSFCFSFMLEGCLDGGRSACWILRECRGERRVVFTWKKE